MSGAQRVRFGIFEADLPAGELRRNGRLVRLQQQPFEVLRMLLARPGELVTREELQRALWPDGITVEFETALNKSVAKLRDALGDQADSPTFIQTLPKRGYRFIAPVAIDDPPARAASAPTPAPVVDLAATVEAPAESPNATATAGSQPRSRVVRFAVIATLAGASLAVAGWYWFDSTSQERVSARARPGLSPIFAAEDAYARGHVAMARRSEEALRSSVTHFATAIALSPQYAEAYVGLADALSLLSSYGLVDPREAMPRARDAANRALSIDPSLVQAHASLGRTAMIFDWDWRTAEFHFTKARAEASKDPRLYQWTAYMLAAAGRHAEAEAEARRAIAADPLSPNTNTALGYVLYLSRQYEPAARQLARTLEMDPDFSQGRRVAALVAVQQRRLDEACRYLERVAQLNASSLAARADLAWAYGLAGRQAEARRLIGEIEKSAATSFAPPDGLAQAHLGLGDDDAALAWLDRALTMRVAGMANLAVEPIWDPLRDHPRFAAIVASVGAVRE